MRRILCKLLVLCALCCLLLSSAQAQVVNNDEFEILVVGSPLGVCDAATNVQVATAINPLQSMCDSWFTPTDGHPDYFYGCDANPAVIDYGVPDNAYFAAGCYDADDPTGARALNQRAYAGIEISDNVPGGYREYICQTLNTALPPNRTYTITFRMRSSTNIDRQLITRIGCLLSTTAPTAASTVNASDGAIDITPLPAGYFYGYADDVTGWKSNGWQYVSVNVTVTGAAACGYLTIGSFEEDIDDADWITQPGGNAAPVGGGQAYYVIDNVSICNACPINVVTVKKTSSDPTKCCYDVTLTDNSGIANCNSIETIRVVTAQGTEEVHGPFIYGMPFELCVDRFGSGLATLEFYDINDVFICQRAVEMKCDCACDPIVNPPDLKIKLVPTAPPPGSSDCCWNVVVDHATGTLNAGKGCDLRTLGISFSFPSIPGVTMTPNTGSGYSTQTSGSVSYLTKNDTTDGDLYVHGTSTTIGTICLPQGTLDFTMAFHVLDQIGIDSVPTVCGLGLFTEVSCANKCCPTGNITAAPFTTPDSLPFTCCFTITAPTTLPPGSPCVAISRIVLQSYDISTGWVTLQNVLGPSFPSHIFSTKACTPIGVAKKVRVVYYDNTNTAVCVKETTIKCEANCCSKVVNMQAYREPQFPCCYRVHGYTNGQGAGCASIVSIVVEHHNGMTWVPNTTGAPDVSGYFDIRVCGTTNPTRIRLKFLDANGNVVCTRWLTLNCSGLGKMGSDAPAERFVTIDSKAWAVPNPASDETTIHYTLLQKSDVQITLFNSIGEVVADITPKHLSVGEQQTTIPTAQLPSGMYYAQISTGNDLITLPITIVR